MSGIQSIPSTKAGTLRTGLLGREILASRSPWIHQQEAASLGLALRYELFDFTANEWGDDRLAAHLKWLQSEGFAGVNVTHPFKQQIIPLLDELAPSAASVGAVNTIRFANGQMVGYNTDVTGFAESMRRGLKAAQIERVVQFGAGGGGSATANALLSCGVRNLTLIDADETKRLTLAELLKAEYPAAQITVASPSHIDLSGVDGVVNATPVGMAAHPGTPFDTAQLSHGMWVADIVYFPLETALLKAARALGCRTLDGRGMAVFQAADAFEIFTGTQVDRNRMLASFDAFAA